MVLPLGSLACVTGKRSLSVDNPSRHARFCGGDPTSSAASKGILIENNFNFSIASISSSIEQMFPGDKTGKSKRKFFQFRFGQALL
jgi:hypothetical protein